LLLGSPTVQGFLGAALLLMVLTSWAFGDHPARAARHAANPVASRGVAAARTRGLALDGRGGIGLGAPGMEF
jgi:hypothetical protein